MGKKLIPYFNRLTEYQRYNQLTKSSQKELNGERSASMPLWSNMRLCVNVFAGNSARQFLG